MKIILPFAFFALGAFAGAGLTYAVRVKAARVPYVDESVQAPRPAEHPAKIESNRALNRDRGGCQSEVTEILQLRNRIQTRQRALSIQASKSRGTPSPLDIRCTPVPWPSDLPEQYREDAIRSVLGTTLEGRAFELDCSEFPCFSVIEGAPADLKDLRRVRADLYADAKVVEQGVGANGRQYHFVAILPDKHNDDQIQARLSRRIDAHARELTRK